MQLLSVVDQNSTDEYAVVLVLEPMTKIPLVVDVADVVAAVVVAIVVVFVFVIVAVVGTVAAVVFLVVVVANSVCVVGAVVVVGVSAVDKVVVRVASHWSKGGASLGPPTARHSACRV